MTGPGRNGARTDCSAHIRLTSMRAVLLAVALCLALTAQANHSQAMEVSGSAVM